MGDDKENTYTKNSLLPGASGFILEDWPCEFLFFLHLKQMQLFALQVHTIW